MIAFNLEQVTVLLLLNTEKSGTVLLFPNRRSKYLLLNGDTVVLLSCTALRFPHLPQSCGCRDWPCFCTALLARAWS